MSAGSADSRSAEVSREVSGKVRAILTPNEEILAVARQNFAAAPPIKDSVVATSNRIILYRPSILGRVQFADFLWEDVKNFQI
ncbi:MAG: PH domain-containing protein [Actinobacteria bacterium]|nr:PH domain-containing protein [Actinomycetota bacterium]